MHADDVYLCFCTFVVDVPMASEECKISFICRNYACSYKEGRLVIVNPLLNLNFCK